MPFFSPHKFLGGPGSPGVLIFDAQFYQNKVPDQPGGGTVTWTNPWGEHHYLPSIEEREDGGTPAFLQTIRAALAIKLKEQMGVQQIMQREEEMVKKSLRIETNSRPAHSCFGCSKTGWCNFILYRRPSLQSWCEIAQRPLWHTGARRLLLRGHVWALPAACFTGLFAPDYGEDRPG